MRAVGDQTRPPLEKDEEKRTNPVSFRLPSPPHRLSFFAPSAKSPRNSSRQTCRRTTKEMLSPRRASVPSTTGRRIEGDPSLDARSGGSASSPLEKAEDKNSVRFCLPASPDHTKLFAPPVKSPQNSFSRAREETKREPRFLMH